MFVVAVVVFPVLLLLLLLGMERVERPLRREQHALSLDGLTPEQAEAATAAGYAALLERYWHRRRRAAQRRLHELGSDQP